MEIDNKGASPKKISIERYAIIKNMVNQLLSLIKVSDNGEKKKVLNVILALVGDSSIQKGLKISSELDNGFLSDYVEDKEAAIDLLSKITFLNGEEEILFRINFYIPDDEEFYKRLIDNNRSFTKMRDFYKDIPEINIVGLKAMECERYMEQFAKFNGVSTNAEESVPSYEKKISPVDQNNIKFVGANVEVVRTSALDKINMLVNGNKEKDEEIRGLTESLANERGSNAKLRMQLDEQGNLLVEKDKQLSEKDEQLDEHLKTITELQNRVDRLGSNNTLLLKFVKDVLTGLGMEAELEKLTESSEKVF